MDGWQKRIQGILDDHVKRGVVGVSLAISRPGGEITHFTSGLSEKFKKTPMRRDHLFRIASCTKTFIATGLHLLCEDGKVDLDEPIARWFPDIPKAGEMPVRILLNHRSGLPDFETSMPMISTKVWTGEEIVKFAFAHGVRKEPWHGMEYSNTGYILAGLIIERETGQNYAQHLRRRIFQPLGMNDTWVGTYEKFPLAREARGYMHADDDAKPQWDVSGAGDPVDGVWDSTEWFPLSGANAAGDMVSTPHDAVVFLNALFGGRILGTKQLAEMKDNIKPASFPGSNVVANGHGLLVMRYGDIEVKGHLGQIPGHTSIMGRDEASGITAMLIQNSGAGDFESFYLKGVNEPAGKVFHAAREGLR
ncbi:MAG TPA: serine hydrolase domain-containing protein [Candidatus Polarisedimenticolia bacterium]|jgi:D-alanyl-D-alanine carboxypeptidase|nr:serine hydrolase domain-containing protein [Candidatus Polarisedimenticolia bacterium]